jgi:2-oxoglutarate ferredoxin oxidoreductase subunit alpha
MSGNAALGEAAVLSGCTCYFGYPITPQNELTEYMAKRMVEAGGVFIQSESEIAAINMVLGAAVAGARAMTSSSGPGISLKQEGISYLAATNSCRHCRHGERRSGMGNIYSRTVRLLSGNTWRRSWRL